MGFFDKVKSMAMKAKCATGFHAGSFTSIHGEPKCRLEKTCPDCFEHVTKTSHKYGDWENYKRHGSCTKERHCVYCDEVDTKVIHEGYVRKGLDDYCTVIEECSRCGDRKKGKEEHMWHKNPGKYEDDHIVETCVRCHKERTRAKVKA